MNRERVTAVLFALLALLALGAAAATLESATAPGEGVGTGDQQGAGAGSGERFDLGAANTTDASGGWTLPPWVRTLVLVVMLALVVVGTYLFFEEYGVRGFVATTLAATVVLGLLWWLLRTLDADPQSGGGGGLLGDRIPSLPGGRLVGGATEAARTAEPPAVLLLVVGVVVVGAVAVVLRATGDDVSPPAPEPAPDDSGTALSAVGRAAGQAADRLEATGETDNEVYRAWREMTTHLDVANPAASTPAEFADAAVDAGMDRGDVAELTGLFEAVRYGGREATAERERRAVDALRRIEDAYAGGDPPADRPREPSEGDAPDRPDRTARSDSRDRRDRRDRPGGEGA